MQARKTGSKNSMSANAVNDNQVMIRRFRRIVSGMVTRCFVALSAIILCGVSLATASEQGPTHEQSVASIACVQRTKDNFGGAGPHEWHDGTYHVQFSMFH